MNKKLKKLLLVSLSIVFILSTAIIGFLMWERQRETQVNAEVMGLLRQQADATVQPDTEIPSETGEEPTSEPVIGEIPTDEDTESTDYEKSVLPKYAELYQTNPDTIGWLQIDGTDINYVVMQTPDEPEKYLRKDFYGSYSTYGTLFLDADCDIETSDNLIIYGHHIRNSAMFGALMDYKDADFWEDHQLVKFASIYEEHTYKVVAAFYAKVLNKDQEGFRYYDFIDAKDADEFNDYVAYINTNQCYDTGVDIAYGDKLLTLSTCAYDTENGRFAVVAKLIDNEAN